MGWRWRKSLNMGAGVRTTISQRGVGVSWGLGGVRIGKSPTGSYWVSLTIPGTGISFFKYISSAKVPTKAGEQILENLPKDQASVSAQQLNQKSLTPNQQVLAKIKERNP